MITCYVHYELNPSRISEFEEYARAWVPLVQKFGGTHHGYAPCTIGDLTSAGFDYWALGHVHGRQVHSDAPWVVMPGTPQGRDIGEPGPKSATVVTIDESITIEEIPTSAVGFLAVKVDVTDVDGNDALRDLLRSTLRDVARDLVSESGVIRLRLAGRTPRRWQMLRDHDTWIETAVQIARETGVLWLDKLQFDLSDDVAPGQVATDELAGLMSRIRAEPGFAKSCREAIEEALKELPPQRRGELLPDEAAMERLAQRLAATGAERS